ncbi:hypothetical protein WICPIJ_000882 [Wickerhamomyces pijperi]|uniref:Uncharacterized protein n=1 Tax=Wickerhamomyces pijperi TaxID=599730 RepID=A0A9P8TR50_WICPI|nr:hypothetical protein WICPIJ_000882 [Wickerhamomyces pijperi]
MFFGTGESDNDTHSLSSRVEFQSAQHFEFYILTLSVDNTTLSCSSGEDKTQITRDLNQCCFIWRFRFEFETSNRFITFVFRFFDDFFS